MRGDEARWGVVQGQPGAYRPVADLPVPSRSQALQTVLAGDEAPRLLVLAAPAGGRRPVLPDRLGGHLPPHHPGRPDQRGIGLAALEGADLSRDRVRVLQQVGDAPGVVVELPAPDPVQAPVESDPPRRADASRPPIAPVDPPATSRPPATPTTPPATTPPPTSTPARPANLLGWPARGTAPSRPTCRRRGRPTRAAFDRADEADEVQLDVLFAGDLELGTRFLVGQAWFPGEPARSYGWAAPTTAGTVVQISPPTERGTPVLAFLITSVPASDDDMLVVVPQPQTGQVDYGADDATEFRGPDDTRDGAWLFRRTTDAPPTSCACSTATATSTGPSTRARCGRCCAASTAAADRSDGRPAACALGCRHGRPPDPHLHEDRRRRQHRPRRHEPGAQDEHPAGRVRRRRRGQQRDRRGARARRSRPTRSPPCCAACRTTCSTSAPTCAPRSPRPAVPAAARDAGLHRAARAGLRHLQRPARRSCPASCCPAARRPPRCCTSPRTVTRRAERHVWALLDEEPDTTSREPALYLNRLSDLLFILSRVSNPGGDVMWQPGGRQAAEPTAQPRGSVAPGGWASSQARNPVTADGSIASSTGPRRRQALHHDDALEQGERLAAGRLAAAHDLEVAARQRAPRAYGQAEDAVPAQRVALEAADAEHPAATVAQRPGAQGQLDGAAEALQQPPAHGQHDEQQDGEQDERGDDLQRPHRRLRPARRGGLDRRAGGAQAALGAARRGLVALAAGPLQRLRARGPGRCRRRARRPRRGPSGPRSVTDRKPPWTAARTSLPPACGMRTVPPSASWPSIGACPGRMPTSPSVVRAMTESASPLQTSRSTETSST